MMKILLPVQPIQVMKRVYHEKAYILFVCAPERNLIYIKVVYDQRLN